MKKECDRCQILFYQEDLEEVDDRFLLCKECIVEYEKERPLSSRSKQEEDPNGE